MKLTELGLKFILIIMLTCVFALVYRDFLILILALIFIFILFLDLILLKLRFRVLRGVRVEPGVLSFRLMAGESEFKRVCLLASSLPGDLKFKPLASWIELESLLMDGVLNLNLTFKPKLSGMFSWDCLEAEFLSRFKFFRVFIRIPFKLHVKVYPRVLPWILRVVKFILVGGLPELGGFPIKRKGLGFEYFESREYVPGDPVRFIDWKASARLSKLIVKEFHEEVFGSVWVVYDVRVLGSVTGDVLASLFLSTMLGVARTGLPIGLIIKCGDKLIYSASSLPPVEALKVALSYVLEFQRFSNWDFYDFVEPRSSRIILRFLERFRAEGLARILKFRLKGDARLPLISLVRSGGRLDISYVGLILYDSRFIVDLFDEVRVRGHRLRIFTPSKPWLDARDLEEAYMIYNSFNRIFSSLKRLGVGVVLG